MKKRIITVDIETLPYSEPFESKFFWDTEEEYLCTALDGNLGRILCIGYCEQDENGVIVEHGCFGWNAESKTFEQDESTILTDFWQFIKGFQKGIDLLIGHNILGFDLPFIIQRSVINGIKPTVNFSLYKYQKTPIFDTMLRWDFYCYKNPTSLRKLTFALGLQCPKSGDIEGAKIYQAYEKGKFEAIYKYCMKDVQATYNIWRKMNFLEPKNIILKEELTKPLALAA